MSVYVVKHVCFDKCYTNTLVLHYKSEERWEKNQKRKKLTLKVKYMFLLLFHKRKSDATQVYVWLFDICVCDGYPLLRTHQ